MSVEEQAALWSSDGLCKKQSLNREEQMFYLNEIGLYEVEANTQSLTVERRCLTPREIDRLIDCPRKYGHYGHRDATMIQGIEQT